MLDFMDYIQVAFAEGTQWNRDNSYSSLTATTQCEYLLSIIRTINYKNSRLPIFSPP